MNIKRNYLLLEIVFITLFFYSSSPLFSQDKPDLNSIKNVIKFENEERKINNILEFNLGSINDIEYTFGHFSRLNVQQCLVTCFGTDGDRASGALNILYSKKGEKWFYDNIKISGGTKSLSIVDVDNDSLNELYLISAWCFGGYGGEAHELYSFKNFKPEIIFTSKTDEFCCGCMPELQLKVGSIVSENLQIEFMDIDNNGIFEIIENKETEIVKSKGKANYKTTKYKTNNIYYLKDGFYVQE